MWWVRTGEGKGVEMGTRPGWRRGRRLCGAAGHLGAMGQEGDPDAVPACGFPAPTHPRLGTPSRAHSPQLWSLQGWPEGPGFPGSAPSILSVRSSPFCPTQASSGPFQLQSLHRVRHAQGPSAAPAHPCPSPQSRVDSRAALTSCWCELASEAAFGGPCGCRSSEHAAACPWALGSGAETPRAPLRGRVVQPQVGKWHGERGWECHCQGAHRDTDKGASAGLGAAL